MKNIFLQGNWILRLTLNPGLALTGFRTTRPRIINRDRIIAKKHTPSKRLKPRLREQFLGDNFYVTNTFHLLDGTANICQ